MVANGHVSSNHAECNDASLARHEACANDRCMDEDYTANQAGGECWVVVGKGAKVRLGPSHLSAPLAPLVPGGIVRVSAGYALDGGWACLSDSVKSSDGTSHRDGWVCVRGRAGEAFLRPFAYQVMFETFALAQFSIRECTLFLTQIPPLEK